MDHYLVIVPRHPRIPAVSGDEIPVDKTMVLVMSGLVPSMKGASLRYSLYAATQKAESATSFGRTCEGVEFPDAAVAPLRCPHCTD